MPANTTDLEKRLQDAADELRANSKLKSSEYEEDFDFAERLEEFNEELEVLNVEARELEERIAENIVKLLETGS